MKTFLILVMLASSMLGFGQEEYINVSAINNNMLSVSNLTESSSSFRIHERVIVIQMEGVTAADSSHKKMQASPVARKYIVVTITDVERNGNAITAIKVSRCLQNQFAINSRSSVHLVSLSTAWNW